MQKSGCFFHALEKMLMHCIVYVIPCLPYGWMVRYGTMKLLYVVQTLHRFGHDTLVQASKVVTASSGKIEWESFQYLVFDSPLAQTHYCERYTLLQQTVCSITYIYFNAPLQSKL